MIEGRVLLADKRKVLVPKVMKTESLLERTRGLLGKKKLVDGEGLLIFPCNSVHTLFMQFSIDVIFLNRENRIIKIIRVLKPFRLGMALNASSVLELMAGQADRIGMKLDDRLYWDPA